MFFFSFEVKPITIHYEKIKNPLLTAIIAACSFLTAYAVTPEEVNCDTPSAMFGETLCIDADGNFKICKHTFWVSHSCKNYYGPIEEVVQDNPQ